jgi:FixJ family two-component response regulator
MTTDVNAPVHPEVVPKPVALNGHVFLVEDDEAMRESMRRVLASQGCRVYPFADPLSFLELVTPVSPAVVVLDMRMPSLSGVEVQARLHEMGMKMSVIFVSGESSVQQAVTAMEKGAQQFLVKPVSRTDLLAAVAQGLASDQKRSDDRLKQNAKHARLIRLAPREREVLQLLLDGYGNAEVSKMIGISYATAKQYKSNIMMKLDVSTMSQLIELMRSEE